MEPYIPQVLPPVELDLLSLVPAIGRASRALGSYSGVLQTLPNPRLLLSPMTTDEAVLSSRIEGTQATLTDVLKFEAEASTPTSERKEDIREIINYRQALLSAETELEKRPFSLSMVKSLHQVLISGVRGKDKAPGNLRVTQNYIAAEGGRLENAVFIPPKAETVPAHMDAWMSYYGSEQPDFLVQLAVIHAQFEIIHPFMDGNGRIGRILIPLFLFEKQILPRPVLYLSGWLEARREEYYGRLRAIGRSTTAWTEWAAFFLRGIDEQARANEKKVAEILALHKKLQDEALSLTSSKFMVSLIDGAFRMPIFQAKHIPFAGPRPSDQTILNLLRTLCEASVLRMVRPGKGRRPAVYACPALLNLCEGKVMIQPSQPSPSRS